MSVVYYISGHGLGHSVRAIEIMRHLAPNIRLLIKSSAPEWFFRQELGRPFEFVEDSFDCGAVQTDSLSIDQAATLSEFDRIAAVNSARMDPEAGWLRSRGAKLVVSDVPSFPLAAARKAGIPNAIVANFTWLEIYEPYLAEHRGHEAAVAGMRSEYGQAEVAFIPALDVPMSAFPRVERMPLVARRGRNLRDEIARELGADAKKRWALFYPGNLGLECDWKALARLDDFVFFTFRAPRNAPANVLELPQGRFRHQDALASMDAAVSKAGYGMVGECMGNGVPMVYTSRDHFAEYEALDRALQEWGGGVRIPQADFSAGRWSEGLLAALALGRRPPERADGGERIASRLMGIMGNGMMGC